MKLYTLLVLWLFSASAWSLQEPRPERGALEELTCEVVQTAEGPSGSRLLVEVRNAGSVHAEPLGFAVTFMPKKKKDPSTTSRVERVMFPYARRFGKGVPPRGKARFWVQVGQLPDGGKFEARVDQACWWADEVPPEPQVTMGRSKQVKIDGQTGQKIEVTSLVLANPHALDVDLVYLATFQEPRNGQALLGVRIRAKSEREWIISELPWRLQFTSDLALQSTRVTKLELVDWCWVGTPDPEAGRRLFLEMDRGWVRWQKPYAGLSGRFAYRSNGDDHDLRCAGTFVLDGEGAVRVTLEGGADLQVSPQAEKTALKAFGELFADVCRPSAEEVLKTSKVREVGDGAFELEGEGWWKGAQNGWSGSTSGKDGEFLPNFTLRDGRLAASGDRDDMSGHLWTTRVVTDGWVVVNRRNASDQWNDTYDYTNVGDRVVPSAYRHRMGFVGRGPMNFITLELSDMRLAEVAAVGAQRAPPSGAGVDALRAAWEFGYRYSGTPREFNARFEVRSPATDGVWLGQKTVVGKVHLRGYRGFMRESERWTSYHIEIDAKLPDAQLSMLGMAVDDRLRLWSDRDFNGRASFEEMFAGATIEAADANGVFRIENGRLSRVVVRDGRVVEQSTRAGHTTQYTWSKVGEAMLVTRTLSGAEDLRVKFSKIGADFVPTSMEFQKVFGDDWGPETVLLSSVKIE